MPVNLPATSHGTAPAIAPPPDPSPPRERPGTPPDGGLAGTSSRKAPGAEGVRPRGVGKLTGLPADLLKTRIVDRLPPDDVARLATVDRALRETGAEYVDEARAAVDKVRQMAGESLKGHPEALNAAFAARDRLPPHERGGLMTHFAAMLDRAPTPEALVSVFDHLSEAAQGLGSPARAEVWALFDDNYLGRSTTTILAG
jgi:hypothetical protein